MGNREHPPSSFSTWCVEPEPEPILMTNATKAADAVRAWYKRSSYIAPPKHRERVMRLYRQSLRTLNNWAIYRDIYLEEGEKIRDQFDAAKHLPPDSP